MAILSKVRLIYARNSSAKIDELKVRLAVPSARALCSGDIERSRATRARFKSVNSINDLARKWRKLFEENGISEPHESVDFIISHVLQSPLMWHSNKLSSEGFTRENIDKIDALCEERLHKKPIQYVLGEWDFRGLVLKMRPPVFIPRPETEGLVDLVLKEMAGPAHPPFLELCCGSGAVSLSILRERSPIKGIAVDQSQFACELTKENAKEHNLGNNLRVIHQRVEKLALFEHKFRVIVSNPPYIFAQDMDNLQPEIKLYEDLKALDGGSDGLFVIKTILNLASDALSDDGKLFLEVEPRHPFMLHNYLTQNPTLRLYLSETAKDAYGKERYVIINKTA